MSERYPADWTEGKLADFVSNIQGGGTPARKESAYWHGPVPWVTVKDLRDDESSINGAQESITREGLAGSSASLIPAGVPILCTRMAVGRTVMPTRPVAINQDLKALFPGSELDARYLHRLLQFKRRELESVAVGSTVKGVRLGDVRRLELGLPHLSEQRRIADVLDTVDAAIRETDAVIAKQEQVKTGLLQDLLTRGLDAEGRLRDPETNPEAFREEEFGFIPKGWDLLNLGNLATHVSSGSTPKGGKKVYQEEGIPFIRSQNVWMKGLDLEDVARIPREIHEGMDRTHLHRHDVLLNITGASIGRCCIVPPSLGEANVNQHVCIIRLPNANRTDATYLSRVLASHIGQSQIDRVQAGGSREGLNYTQIKSFSIPWPSPKERNRIIDSLAASRDKQSADRIYRSKLQHLKTGLMQDLLTGRVRVPEAEERINDVIE